MMYDDEADMVYDKIEDLEAENARLKDRVEELKKELRRENNRQRDKPPYVFTIRYELEKDLTMDDLWPEEDYPEDPEVSDVFALIQEDGGCLRVLEEWNLAPDLSCTITRSTPDE